MEGVEQVDESTFRIGDVTFVSDMAAGVSSPERFAVMKRPDLMERYLDLPRGGRVVELGIREGGSTAFLALALEVRRLVAFELDAASAPALVDLVARQALGDTIRPYFGVDQADRARLAAVVDDEFDGAPLDLVVDDAFHRLGPTLVSFETLFPRLRPGGRYVIEDWAWQHSTASSVERFLADPGSAGDEELLEALNDRDHEVTAAFDRAVAAAMEDPTEEQAELFAAGMAAALEQHDLDELRARHRPPPPAEPPMMRLIVQLLLAAAMADDVVTRVEVDRDWVVVTRGGAALDATTFRLADVAPDHHGVLDVWDP